MKQNLTFAVGMLTTILTELGQEKVDIVAEFKKDFIRICSN